MTVLFISPAVKIKCKIMSFEDQEITQWETLRECKWRVNGTPAAQCKRADFLSSPGNPFQSEAHPVAQRYCSVSWHFICNFRCSLVSLCAVWIRLVRSRWAEQFVCIQQRKFCGISGERTWSPNKGLWVTATGNRRGWDFPVQPDFGVWALWELKLAPLVLP